MTAGVRTVNLPDATVVDSLLGNYEGNSVQIEMPRLTAMVSAQLGPTYATRAQLYADLAWPERSVGYVRGDGTAAYNGVYRKTGATGAGNWSRVGDLPSGAVEAAQINDLRSASARGDILVLTGVAGTAQAVTASLHSSQSFIELAVGQNVQLEWPVQNTGANPTLTLGGITFTILRHTGGALAAGDLRAGRRYTLTIALIQGNTGNMRLQQPVSPADVGLANINDTSDEAKPVSTAQATAIAQAKQQAIQEAGQASSAALAGAVAGLTEAQNAALQEAAEAEALAIAEAKQEAVSEAVQASSTAINQAFASLEDQRVHLSTAAPIVLAVTDPQGFAKFVMREDGTTEGIVDQVRGGNALHVPGVAFVDADVMGYAGAAQAEDGSMIVADPAPPRGIAGDVHLLLMDGQIPLVASATVATSVTPVAGLKMFNVGAFPSTAEFNAASTAMTSFVPHVEEGNESSARGAAEGLLAGAIAAGRPIIGDIVSVVTAVGGQSVAALSPGGAYWHHKTSAIDRWAAICAAEGRIPGQVFWAVWQGEADTATPMGGAAWAAQWEATRQALEAYIATVIGWRVEVVQVHMQTAASYWYNRALPLISEAANLLAQYPRMFGPFATYDFEYGAADGNGAHLSNAREAHHAGWRAGWALGHCWAGVRPARIVPLQASRIGPRAVRIDYGGGFVAPLQLDTSVVTDPGNFGYEIGAYDQAGVFTALTLASVAVAGGEAVILRTAADLPASRLVIRYGYIGGQLDDADPDANGSISGRLTGARGCLQAATGTAFTFNGAQRTDRLRPSIHHVILE